jgi:phosphatidylglycerophosphatase A
MTDARKFMSAPASSEPVTETTEGTGKRTAWAWTIATFFGAGFWRIGPGTAGSIAAVAIWFAASHSGYVDRHHITVNALRWLTAATALVFLILGIPASTIVARESGRKDPGFVVVDEAVGQWITLLATHADWRYALFGLLLFRIFDVWKPPPIRMIERLPGGWGIMLDDVGAGIYAWICLQLLRFWMP